MSEDLHQVKASYAFPQGCDTIPRMNRCLSIRPLSGPVPGCPRQPFLFAVDSMSNRLLVRFGTSSWAYGEGWREPGLSPALCGQPVLQG